MRANDLLQHAPAFHQWVDDLLVKHQLSATQIAAYGFQKLPQFFSPETLAEAKCIEVDSIPKIPWQEFGLPIPEGMEINFEGITFRNTYFLTRRDANDESLHFHEMVHVVQWQMLGNELFPLIYALEALKGSYQTNMLEAIAREITDFFVKAEEPFNTEFIIAAWIGQNLPPIFTQFIKGEL